MVDALLEFIKGKREISATKVSTAPSLLKKIVPGQTMGLAIAIRAGGAGSAIERRSGGSKPLREAEANQHAFPHVNHGILHTDASKTPPIDIDRLVGCLCPLKWQA